MKTRKKQKNFKTSTNKKRTKTTAAIFSNTYISDKHNNISEPKCNIDNTDRIIITNTRAIIVITETKRTYKIFPIRISTLDIDQPYKIAEELRIINNEQRIMELLTTHIINTNISNHIVRYFGSNKCSNIADLFGHCPKKYVDFMRQPKNKKDERCILHYWGYPIKKMYDEYSVMEIEYCDYSTQNYIRDISRLSIGEMKLCLDILLFQIIYTLVSIQKVFPFFSHGDLFMRNVIGLKDTESDKFYIYNYNNKSYFVPQKRFYPKINDFGASNLNEDYKFKNLFISEYKDMYTILIDIYYGGSVGSIGLKEICKNDRRKCEFLREYFGNYFNVSVVDQYFANMNKHSIILGYNLLDMEYRKSLRIRSPSELLDEYFYNIFRDVVIDVKK